MQRLATGIPEPRRWQKPSVASVDAFVEIVRVEVKVSLGVLVARVADNDNSIILLSRINGIIPIIYYGLQNRG